MRAWLIACFLLTLALDVPFLVPGTPVEPPAGPRDYPCRQWGDSNPAWSQSMIPATRAQSSV